MDLLRGRRRSLIVFVLSFLCFAGCKFSRCKAGAIGRMKSRFFAESVIRPFVYISVVKSLLTLCQPYARHKIAAIKISSVCDLCLCNLGQPRSSIPVLLLELRPHLLRTCHQSEQCRLVPRWISSALTPTRCVRPVSLSHISARVSCSPRPPESRSRRPHTLSPSTQRRPKQL